MIINQTEIPLALAMLDSAKRLKPDGHHLQQTFICHWIAFENIYTALAADADHRPSFNLRKNGTLQTHRVGKIKIAAMKMPPKRELIALALTYFSQETKDHLIRHENTPFFIKRSPTWRQKPRKRDAFNQPLNGVINIAATISPQYPVWSPLDSALYKQYCHQQTSTRQRDKARDILAEQLLDLLHTIYQNLIQGGPRTNSESGNEVVAKALPLLSLIVHQFLDLE